MTLKMPALEASDFSIIRTIGRIPLYALFDSVDSSIYQMNTDNRNVRICKRFLFHFSVNIRI